MKILTPRIEEDILNRFSNLIIDKISDNQIKINNFHLNGLSIYIDNRIIIRYQNVETIQGIYLNTYFDIYLKPKYEDLIAKKDAFFNSTDIYIYYERSNVSLTSFEKRMWIIRFLNELQDLLINIDK